MNHNVTKSNGVMSPRCYLFYQFFGCRVCRLTRLVGSNEHGLHEKLENRLFRRSLLKNLTGSILLRLVVQQHYAPVVKRGEQGRNRDFECQQSSDSCIGDQPSIYSLILAQQSAPLLVFPWSSYSHSKYEHDRSCGIVRHYLDCVWKRRIKVHNHRRTQYNYLIFDFND